METILLVLALSLDAFVASIAYGTNKIKIPFKSIIIIDSICAISLVISLLLGGILSKILPDKATIIISFFILMGIGIYYLFESFFKNYLKGKKKKNGKVKLKLFNIFFIIEIYIDETKADIDNSRILSSKEALYLATALSLDSLAIGFGSGLLDMNILYILFASLIMDLIAIWSGLFIGKTFVDRAKIDLSWLAGMILILLAVLKLR
ncbi:MAG: sporulation membrane protein YtaF [Tissierellia bacterium]|nr:sporulation membrane protein YtaF [Tissierellia bacterium]